MLNLKSQFGEHYVAENIKYRFEVARFAYVGDLKIDGFENGLLDEKKQFFIRAFRDRLMLAMKHFEECEELVISTIQAPDRRSQKISIVRTILRIVPCGAPVKVRVLQNQV